MADIVNTGAAANDGSGDDLRTAFQLINERFQQLLGTLSQITWAPGLAISATPLRQWTVQAGQAYVAASNHTAGATFAADLSAGKWLAVDVLQMLIDLATDTDGKGSEMVAFDGGTVQDVLDAAKPMQSYAALRAYTGRATGVRITQQGIAGHFFRDASDSVSADNGGTTIVDASGRRWKRLADITVSVRWFGATGNGVTDDTAAIIAAHAASHYVHYPHGVYKVQWPESTPLVTYSNGSHIRVTGDGAVLLDTRAYAADSISAVYQLTTCTDVVIDGLGYEGQPIADKSNATTGVGYRGATFVNLSTNCRNITVKADLKYLRYGVRGGDYSQPSLGGNNNLRGNLTTVECGYPLALYLSDGVDFDITAEGSHRTAYLAGVRHGRCHARFKNQYIAPSQVLLTDATTNGLTYPNGISRGCANLDIKAHDMGSTIWTANSFCSAISMSRGDAGTLFENIAIDVYVKSNDTTAATLSSFALFNNFTPIQPSYPNNWESSFLFRNIKLTGTLDRSEQTIAENSANGEIYIFASDGTRHATVQGLDISGFRYYPGSGAKTRGFWYIAPGLVGTSRIESCDFGTATPVLLGTNNTSVLSVVSTQLRGSYSGTSDAPYNSNIAFADSTIADPAHQPLANKTFSNTTIRGSKSSVVTKIIDATLTGASVSLSAAIPGGVVVVGVSGVVTTAITGASGFEVGVTGDLTRYASKVATAQGTLVNAITDSTATAPINYASATNLIVTPKTASFTGGVLRLAVHYMQFTGLQMA